MRKLSLVTVLLAVLMASCSGKADVTETAAPVEAVSAASAVDSSTSASVVPEEYVRAYAPKGFSDSDSAKALFIVGDPRHYSVNFDMAYTAMKFFEENGVEVELRDLYAMNWNPVLSMGEFYYQKDGKGEPSADVKAEQELVSRADYIVFVYPNWHDTQNAIVKGYIERVFAKKFAYQNTENGLEGLLKDKSIFTISNCGFLGGGRGYIGDGKGIDDAKWDSYMNAFKVLDDDTAGFWGVENKGRFMNDRTPSNSSGSYESEIAQLRSDLEAFLKKVFF